MYPPAITETLAAERRTTMHHQADAFRLAKQARDLHHPPHERLLYRAAAAVRRLGVRIRPIQPADAALLNDGFARLSPESRRLRFLGPKSGLSASELRYFTEVDHHDHEALVAVSRWSGRGLGVARFVKLADDPTTADVAVVVVDDWQRLGLGTALVDRLIARARCEGVARFSALLAAENDGARRLMRRTGAPVRLVSRDGGTQSYEVELAALERRPAPVRRTLLAPADCAGAA
jgi:GNAT superfamily N-acetyltransferase